MTKRELLNRLMFDAGGEAVFALLMPLLSIFWLWQSMQISEPPSNTLIGPRAFPVAIGLAMLFTSIVLIWERVMNVLGTAADEGVSTTLVPAEEEETAIGDWGGVRAVLIALLALCVFLEMLGFVTSIALFLCGLSTFFSPRHWILNASVSISFSVFFYWLFTRILEIALPNGILSSVF